MSSAHIVIAKRPFQGVLACVPVASMVRGNAGHSIDRVLGWSLGKYEGSIHPGEESA